MALTKFGFCFSVDGKAVKMRFEGKETPEQEQVQPLVDLVRQHKDEVHFFLRCHCPRCGGSFFGTFNGVEQCLGCYYADLENAPPRQPGS